MQLKLEHPGYQQMQLHEDAPPVDILLGEGSVFRLDPQDEMRLPRVVDGSVFRGAFFHGMRQGLPAGQISCGFVFRVWMKPETSHVTQGVSYHWHVKCAHARLHMTRLRRGGEGKHHSMQRSSRSE